MKIISICPSNTELAYYLGLENQLIAIDDYSDWPKSVNKLPRLGPDLSIDIDKIEDLQPDVVLASLSVPGMEKNIAELKRRKIRHVVFQPNTLEDIASDLRTLGQITGRQKRAENLISIYRNTLEQYKSISASITNKPTIYWEWWPKPVFTPGKLNWLTEISELAGGKNLFYDQEAQSVQTTWDDVVERKPDVICLAWVGVHPKKVRPEAVAKRPGMDCFPSTAIHVLEEQLYCRPSPRLLVGLQKLGHLLHPTLYPSFSSNYDPLILH